ncbi:MAG: glycosyltransferase family 2 protein [Porticoccaceae bacterium]|nr:glycosyltransferase family 2 protein [Porticoccaceae bacterium]
MIKQPGLVTVGIPTYNRADMLRRSIDSVLRQDYAQIEVLISDNFSTDNTQSVCQQFCEKDRRVRYVQQSSNIGASANFKDVLTRASGEYFMWLGDDDWIDSAYVSSCVSLLASDLDTALVSGAPQYYSEGKKVSEGKMFNLEQRSWVARVVGYYGKVADNGMFYGIMRTAKLQQVNIPNTMAGDWHLLANIVSTGKTRMLTSVSVHRELGGATASYRKIAESLGLPKIQAVLPMATAACGAWKNIIFNGQLYKSRNILRRVALANVVFIVVALKNMWRYLGFIKRFLKLDINK